MPQQEFSLKPRVITRTEPTSLGYVGECIVKDLVTELDPTLYVSLHNALLPVPGATTTQIDSIIFSKYGIFVIEAKHYGGHIYGQPTQRIWNQVLYSKRYSFQNPLHQNYKHVRVLQALTKLPLHIFKDLVYFTGDAVLESTPLRTRKNIVIGELMGHIRGHTKVLLPQSLVDRAIDLTVYHTLKQTPETLKAHWQAARPKHPPAA